MMSKNNTPNLGGLFMVGIPGTIMDASTEKLITEERVHNFILFKRNVENKKQLQTLCNALKQTCIENNLPAPLISIDQEGGSVTRLPPPYTQFPHQRELANSENSQKELQDYARICAKELKETGINMNLAPVLDVCPEEKGFFMEQRSLGANPKTVAELGELVINEMQSGEVATCAKHFPGLGKAVIDPHLHLPVVTASAEEMAETDFLPFAAACKAGVASFMTSHTIYTNLDPDRPATLSPIILNHILRDRINFQGLVITDDLEMGAIEENGAIEDAALESFMAGADLLLICHEHEKVNKSLQRMRHAIADGMITDARIELSLRRQQAVRDLFA